MVMGFPCFEITGVNAFDVTRIRGEQYEIAHSILIMVSRVLQRRVTDAAYL
jgi:hypothetical protein